MGLKIKTPDGMKKIDTNLHKPVTFISGTKYKIDKAWTFLNGVKYQIWGESGVQIDYIKSDNYAYGYLNAIGENWAVSSWSGNTNRVNISNFTNPQLIQTVAWGGISQYNGFNGYLSGNNSMIFQTSINKITLNPSTGTLSATSGGAYYDDGQTPTTVSSVGISENYIAQAKSKSKGFVVPQTGRITNIKYGTDFYWGGVLKYSCGREPASTSDTSGTLYIDTSLRPVQVAADTFLVGLNGQDTTNVGTYNATYSGLTKRSGTFMSGIYVLDGNILCRNYFYGSSGSLTNSQPTQNMLALVDNSTLASLYTYGETYSPTNKVRLIFLGRLDDYYYCVQTPFDESATTGVKLILLNKADLSVAYQKDLPADPFNENNGTVKFWVNAYATAQISQTGFLGVASYNSTGLKWRVARFSGIF